MVLWLAVACEAPAGIVHDIQARIKNMRVNMRVNMSSDFGLWSDDMFCFYIIFLQKFSSFSFPSKIAMVKLVLKEQLAFFFLL